MYQLTPNVTKDFILSRISEETIFDRYLCPVQFNYKVINPLRSDRTPTCCFYYDRARRLVFHDYAGYFHGDCFEVVKFIHRCNYNEALYIIAKDFDLITVNNFVENRLVRRTLDEVKNTKTEIKVKRKEWELQDKRYWKSFGLNGTILDQYKVTPAQTVWVNGEVAYSYNAADPCYIYYFMDGDYKLYFPARKEYRFMCNTKKLQGYNQVPLAGEILVIAKSLKDVMVYSSFNIPAVAPQSEGTILTPEQYNDLSQRFNLIVSNYDFDRAGIRSALKMRNLYGIQPLFLTNGKYGTFNHGAKDISDFIRRFGIVATRELISNVYNEIIT
jgi:hypothetical protein